GVNVLSHRGTRELSHSGSTGGYRAHLLAFPERRAGIAVLCNGAGLNATQLAEQLADSLVGPRTRRPRASEPVARPVASIATQPAFPASQWASLAGTYASDEVGGEPFVVSVESGELVLRRAPETRLVLRPGAGALFQAAGQLLWFDRDASGQGRTLRIAAFESDTTLVVERAVGDVITLLRYTWAHDGTAHDGVLLVRDTAPDAPPAMVWADSFHTGGTFMSLGPGQRTAQGVSATGSYAAPPGPDWGWRIALEATAPAKLTLRMYNITPDGEEALAVEAIYSRST
ncbi:MAG: DUF1579 domain-containing protein, partial [Gemmatimonadaceae bacterium]|nr:DUF1579 domain-containing protein [Gemmatimonadaceae bacterium]